MKRSLFLEAVALSTCTMLAVSAPAWAHVVVSPEEVMAGDYETLTVSVPTEKEVREGGEATSNHEGTTAGADVDSLATTGGASYLVYAGLGVGALAVGTLLVRRLLAS